MLGLWVKTLETQHSPYFHRFSQVGEIRPIESK